MDIYTPEKRSAIMSRIRGKNTVLETDVFKHLKSKGIYFQKHYARIPGKPDIALPNKKIAIFIDSDFWHGWRFSKWGLKLAPFWRNKINGNIKRDMKIRSYLKRNGWKVLRVWEHSLKIDKEKMLNKIGEFLTQ